MGKTIKDDYCRCGPYCFKKMSDGRYLALNRDYLPIDRSRDDVGGRLSDSDYGSLLESAHREFGVMLTSKEIDIIKHSGDENMFFLYDDESAPWKDAKCKTSYDKKMYLVPKLARLA